MSEYKNLDAALGLAAMAKDCLSINMRDFWKKYPESEGVTLGHFVRDRAAVLLKGGTE